MAINIARLRDPGWPPSVAEVREMQKKFTRMFPEARDSRGQPLKIDGKVGVQMIGVVRFLLDQVEIDQAWFERHSAWWDQYRRQRKPREGEPPERQQAPDHVDDA